MLVGWLVGLLVCFVPLVINFSILLPQLNENQYLICPENVVQTHKIAIVAKLELMFTKCSKRKKNFFANIFFYVDELLKLISTERGYDTKLHVNYGR